MYTVKFFFPTIQWYENVNRVPLLPSNDNTYQLIASLPNLSSTFLL